jgi:Cft2 family RNA processing exonuclease
MLQSGLSRDLFEAWCESSQNTVIIADFAVQGTLAREIKNSPSHVMSRQGVKVSSLENNLVMRMATAMCGVQFMLLLVLGRGSVQHDAGKGSS